MAIQRGPYGTGWVKRLGNSVGIKLGGGKYGIISYQPNVINPKSVKQNVQRAKFAFLQQMGGIVGGNALLGLSNLRYKSVQNAFNSINIANLVVDNPMSNPKVNLELSAPNMRLASGYEVTPVVSVGDQGTPSIKLSAQTRYGSAGNRPDAVRFVIIVANYMSMMGYVAQVEEQTYTSFNDGVASTLAVDVVLDTMGITPSGETLGVMIYAYNIRYQPKRGSFGISYPNADINGNLVTLTNVAGVDAVSGWKRYSNSVFTWYELAIP